MAHWIWLAMLWSGCRTGMAKTITATPHPVTRQGHSVVNIGFSEVGLGTTTAWILALSARPIAFRATQSPLTTCTVFVALARLNAGILVSVLLTSQPNYDPKPASLRLLSLDAGFLL